MSHYQIRETDAIDTRHPVDFIEPESDARMGFAEAQCRLIVWLMTNGDPQKMGARVMVLATALQLTKDTVNDSDIAKACGVSRSAVSLMCIELEQQFGIKSYNLRPEGTRARCRKAQKSRKK